MIFISIKLNVYVIFINVWITIFSSFFLDRWEMKWRSRESLSGAIFSPLFSALALRVLSFGLELLNYRSLLRNQNTCICIHTLKGSVKKDKNVLFMICLVCFLLYTYIYIVHKVTVIVNVLLWTSPPSSALGYGTNFGFVFGSLSEVVTLGPFIWILNS